MEMSVSSAKAGLTNLDCVLVTPLVEIRPDSYMSEPTRCINYDRNYFNMEEAAL